MKVTQEACMLVNKFLNLWKLMGSTNVFVGCNLFNMYAKSGNKKYGMKWLLLFVIQKALLEWANTTLFLFFLGLILVTFEFWYNFQVWFSQSTHVCNPHCCCYGGKCWMHVFQHKCTWKSKQVHSWTNHW